MTQGAIVCAACGAKVRATRTRCPKCRAVLASPLPAEVRVSGPAMKIAGGVLAVVFIAAVVILWRGEGSPPPAIPQTKPADPSARTLPGPLVGREPAEVPLAPPFELASALTPVPESTDDAAALAGLQNSLESDSQNAATLYNIGRLLLRLGRPREAVAPLKQALALKGDNWSYAFSAGYALALSEQFSEAVSAFRLARGLMPNDAATSYDLALALQRLGDYAGAAEEYVAAIRLNSGAISPKLGQATSLDRLGKVTEALAAYEECLRLMPPGPEAERVRARVERLRGA
jgi:tetratricopeptide (TPR) repeat protein